MDTDKLAVASERFTSLCVFRARRGYETELEQTLVGVGNLIRNDPGLVGFTLARSVEIPSGYMALARWEDRITMTESFLIRREAGLAEKVARLCDSVSFDVLVPCDPPGLTGKPAGRIANLIATHIVVPLASDAEAEFVTMIQQRDQLASCSGCNWAYANVHADHGDFLFLCSGWDSRTAWETANQTLQFPTTWTDPGRMLTAASLDLLEPLLEIIPDRYADAF